MHFFWSYTSTEESNDTMGVTGHSLDGGDDDIKELCIYKKVQNLYLYKYFNNNFHKFTPQVSHQSQCLIITTETIVLKRSG
jgi:hypothetical protein